MLEDFSQEELLAMVKEQLDALGIPYEEKPGGFPSDWNWLE